MKSHESRPTLFEAGCPSGGRVYDMLTSYTAHYLKRWDKPEVIEAHWKDSVQAAVTRYEDWVGKPR